MGSGGGGGRGERRKDGEEGVCTTYARPPLTSCVPGSRPGVLAPYHSL